jgi:hypothetical protein
MKKKTRNKHKPKQVKTKMETNETKKRKHNKTYIYNNEKKT